jgi:DNA repair exonuclease SbcCD ATPase subunit
VAKSNGDRADGSDKLRVAKKRIESLKREVDKLRKELNKARQFVEEAKNVLEEKQIEYDETPRKKKKEIYGCDNCGKGEYETFSLTVAGVVKFYHTCSLCGSRKVEIKKE